MGACAQQNTTVSISLQYKIYTASAGTSWEIDGADKDNVDRF